MALNRPPNNGNSTSLPQKQSPLIGGLGNRKFMFTQKQVMAALLECRGQITKTAEHLGTGYPNLTKYIDKNPRVKEFIGIVKEAKLDRVEDELYELATSGDFQAVKFYLQTHGKTRGYKFRDEIDPSEMAKPINFFYNVVNPRDDSRKSITHEPQTMIDITPTHEGSPA